MITKADSQGIAGTSSILEEPHFTIHEPRPQNAPAPRPETGTSSPWLYAIAEPDGSWHDGEQCVFGDAESAQDEVNLLNDDLKAETSARYSVVPLYCKPPAAASLSEEQVREAMYAEEPADNDGYFIRFTDRLNALLRQQPAGTRENK